MKVKTFLHVASITLLGLFSSYSLAATFTPFANGYLYVNTDNTIDSNGYFTNTLTGPSSAYTVSGAGNPVLFADDLATELGTDIFNFNKTDVSGGLTGEINRDTSFNGIVLKTATVNLVAIFDSPLSSVAWNMLWSADLFDIKKPKDLSHFSTFNTNISAIPIPAALWLFGPALLGFMGFRRRLSK